MMEIFTLSPPHNCQGFQVLTGGLQNSWGVRICTRTAFRARNGELKVPVCQEREAITLRSGMPDQNELHIGIHRNRNPTPHISWYPRVFSGRFTEPNAPHSARFFSEKYAELLFKTQNMSRVLPERIENLHGSH